MQDSKNDTQTLFRRPSRWQSWLSRLWPAGGCTSGFNTLHSIERMRAILERERMRSDRGNASFTLLSLTFPKRLEEEHLAVLAEIVGQRTRATDDAGFLGRRAIGVVLPETPADGAWTLAEDLCERLPKAMGRPRCAVYAYPADGDEQGEPAAVAALDGAVVGGPDDSETPPGPSRPMQPLFVQPLPAWKRMLDVLGSGAALIVAAPVILLAAVAIKLTSRGPVFFAQDREGLGGRRFKIYKLRTMIVNAESLKDGLRAISEQDGPAFKLKNDPRVTPVGRFLRRTCIDELPQLFNVLRGDMSLVGPRPLPCDESRKCQIWGRRRLDVTPGLTCTWQVYGGTRVTFTDWMRMDLRYSGSRSLWKDLRLMAMTVPSVIRRDGVY